MNITKQIKNIEPVVEWATARTAARRLEGILTDEITYLTEGNKLQNVYSPIAWVRLYCGCRHDTGSEHPYDAPRLRPTAAPPARYPWD